VQWLDFLCIIANCACECVDGLGSDQGWFCRSKVFLFTRVLSRTCRGLSHTNLLVLFHHVGFNQRCVNFGQDTRFLYGYFFVIIHLGLIGRQHLASFMERNTCVRIHDLLINLNSFLRLVHQPVLWWSRDWLSDLWITSWRVSTHIHNLLLALIYI